MEKPLELLWVNKMKDQIFAQMKDEMGKAIAALEKSLSKVRTGRASLSLLDGIKVEYYGTPTPLNQMASLSIPENRLIVISPWDTGVINSIEKAIQKADLGMNPTSDGKVIRLSIPPLTEERRKDLVKQVKKIGEECKIKQRNARREANERLKSLKTDNKMSEDELHVAQDEVQKITDKQIEKTDAVIIAKEKEIMEI